ncbi:MAG: hypothetical protein V4473_01920 [Patescibacteria group bacterium]
MNHSKFVRIFLLILIIIGIGLLVTQKMWVPKTVDTILKKDQNTFKNQVVVTSKVSLTDLERGQIEKSVDEFMNEYKLPKGVQNSYTFSIEKRLNDSIQIIVDADVENNTVVLYARKTNYFWQVDPSAGPWCTLESFDDKSCF